MALNYYPNCILKVESSYIIDAVTSPKPRKPIRPKRLLKICYFCGKSRSELPTHFMQHTREKHYKCPVCNLRFKSFSLTSKHISTSTHPKAFTCTTRMCAASFRTEPEYLKHVRNKHDGPFKCPFDEYRSSAAKIYKKKTALTAHIAYHHQGGREKRRKTHKCLLCNKQYGSRVGLRQHERFVHEKEPKKNTCSFCHKKFMNKTSMTRHVNVVHLGQKEVTKCTQSECELVFNCASSMRNHRKKVHRKWLEPTTRFKCQEMSCSKTYKDASKLRDHVRFIHLGETRPRNQICKLCNVGFPTYAELEDHIAVIHTGEKPYRCDRAGCNKSFHKKTLLSTHLKRVHLSKELGIRFKCDKCPGLYWSKSSLASHRRRKHLNFSKKKELYPCYFCQEVKPSKKSLQNHIRHHTGEQPFQCYECGIDFRTSTQFQFHNLRHHDMDNPRYAKIPCPTCGKLLNKQRVQKHILIVHKMIRPHKCSQCDRKFSTKAAVKSHIRITHLGEKIMLKCQHKDCSKQFKSTSGFRSHTIVCHPRATDPTEYPCKFCSKIYYNPNGLASHVRDIHRYGPNNRPYPCNLCGKSYLQKGELFGHISGSHTKERAFKCDRCEKTFGSSGNLSGHKRIPRDQDAGRNYPCTQCASVFIHRTGLESHIYFKHSSIPPWVCYFCGDETNSHRPTTTNHIQRHTKEKPHKCNKCGKMCRDISSHRIQKHGHRMVRTKAKSDNCYFCSVSRTRQKLVSHMRKHIGEKPFKCRHCGVDFPHEDILKTHVKRSHKKQV